MWVPLAGIALALALVYLNPFQYAVSLLTNHFAQAPAWTSFDKGYADASIQEVSHGEHPAESFAILAASYRTDTRRRVDLIGNSQTYTFVLAPGERLPSTTEKTYPDLVADHYHEAIHFYRLSAPNISYTEVLWYLEYLDVHRELLPDDLIVQVNYETFRKTGIRPGIQELLADAGFRQRIREISAGNRFYSGVFQQAVSEYDQRLRAAAQAHNTATSNTGLTESDGLGGHLETQARKLLAKGGFSSRQANARSDLLMMLYLLRVYALNLKPSTPRSLAPAAVAANGDALSEVARVCRRDKIALQLMNAPQNPRAPLYKTDADRQKYRAAVEAVASKFSLPVFDFENRIPADEWGSWADGPDPIHFGIQGHHRMAELMIESGIVAQGR